MPNCALALWDASGKKVKKLSKQDHAEVERQIQKLLDNPNLGDVKKQDLAGVHVHKFKLNRKEILLSYRFTEESIILITMGGHENYYRDLKKYIQ